MKAVDKNFDVKKLLSLEDECFEKYEGKCVLRIKVVDLLGGDYLFVSKDTAKDLVKILEEFLKDDKNESC